MIVMHKKTEAVINSITVKHGADSTAKKVGYIFNSHTMIPIPENIHPNQLVKNDEDGTNKKSEHVTEVSTLAELEEFIAKLSVIPAKK